ncbi:MAG: putative manganese-dependent inorganic diphosphatase [Pseudoramibacter sp.]
MSQMTYVFGHQKPDTDSICSALAYAYLKRETGSPETMACRLGPINKETQYALDTFGVQPPRLIKSVKPQVCDIHLNNDSMVTEQNSIHHTMDLIIDNPGRSLPVVDEQRKLIGIISLPDIMHAYSDPFQKDRLMKSRTPFRNILRALDGTLVGEEPEGTVKGCVYNNSQLQASDKLSPDDIVLTTRNDSSLDMAFANGNAYVIVSDVPKGTDIAIPEDFSGTTILTEKSLFEVVRLLEQVTPIRQYVNHDTMEFFMMSETLEDVKSNMLSSPHNRFPVVTDEGVVLGTITKSSLLDYQRKRVILVDHNEKTQSINGLEDAEIAEIIDHHRVAEVQTDAPLYMRVEPLGCTCTIITKMYHEKNVPIPKNIAGLLLSAIVSDTLLFNSPTCTEQDKAAAHELAEIAGVNLKEYGRSMLIAGSNLGDLTPAQIIGTDRKIFTMGDYKVEISQINTGDYKSLFDKLHPLLDQMQENCEKENADLAILMVTDIVLGGSELLIAGKERHLVRDAFGIEDEDISQFFPGMFSRKKQVVPPLMRVASSEEA